MKRRFELGWRIRLGVALLVLTLFGAYRFTELSAKYVVQDNGADAARVAAFSFDLANGNNSAIIDLSNIQKPGDSEVYRFDIVDSSEVGMRYWIGLSLDGSMPLECAVTRNRSAVVSTTLAQLRAAVPDNLPLTATSAPATFTPNASGAHSYTLTVTWPAAENNLEYANDSVAELTLQILAEQVD